jgi:hypothetical protein
VVVDDPFADWMVHWCTVERLTETDYTGAHDYDPPVPVNCFVDRTTTMTRNSQGEEVTSTGTLYGVPKELAELFTPGSRVTYEGWETQVISRAVSDDPGNELEGVQVALQ